MNCGCKPQTENPTLSRSRKSEENAPRSRFLSSGDYVNGKSGFHTLTCTYPRLTHSHYARKNKPSKHARERNGKRKRKRKRNGTQENAMARKEMWRLVKVETRGEKFKRNISQMHARTLGDTHLQPHRQPQTHQENQTRTQTRKGAQTKLHTR